MKFKEIFKDDNTYNEKAIIGFIAFAVMIIVILTELIANFFDKNIVVSEHIYDSFLYLVLGSFTISGAERVFKKKDPNEN